MIFKPNPSVYYVDIVVNIGGLSSVRIRLTVTIQRKALSI